MAAFGHDVVFALAKATRQPVSDKWAMQAIRTIRPHLSHAVLASPLQANLHRISGSFADDQAGYCLTFLYAPGILVLRAGAEKIAQSHRESR